MLDLIKNNGDYLVIKEEKNPFVLFEMNKIILNDMKK